MPNRIPPDIIQMIRELSNGYSIIEIAKKTNVSPGTVNKYKNKLLCSIDKGCTAWPSCTGCPLPVCLEDLPWQEAKQIKDKLKEDYVNKIG